MALAEEFSRWRQQLLDDVQKMLVDAIGSIRAPIRVVDVPFVIGTRGAVLAANDHAFLRLGLNAPATILSWSLAVTVAGASTSGTCVLDVLVGTTLTGATSICSSNRPSLTAQAERDDQPPTSWTTSIPDPRWIMVTVVSTDGTIEEAGLTLRMSVDAR